jgi:hypothetical protein
MKKINFFLILTISFFLLPFGFIPKTFSATQDLKNLNTSQVTISDIRIAIYNEPNVTETSYSAGGTYTNNYSAIMQFLESKGYQVTELTCMDIYNHQLLTVNYDLFIMVDNTPRENITKHVKEFWLGGGGLLSFDSALPYLLYEGILIPESEGDHGWGTYFTYQSGTNHNISTLSPITKDYQIGDKFSSAGTFMCYLYWDILLGTSAGADTIKLANRDGNNNAATAVARDPQNKGGRVAHLPGLGNVLGTNMSNMINEAVQWLCPKPKGRILYDLSHSPRLGIDLWDDLAAYPGYYTTWRDDLVSRGYLVDKLYPSPTANFSSSRLKPYDMLILVSPDLDYSSSDRSAVTKWINNGGSLLVLGDDPLISDFATTNARINYLLDSFNLRLNLTIGITGIHDLNSKEHPTVESCSILTVASAGAINMTGDAFEIWNYGVNGIVAGQESGSGRIILIGDMNWCSEAYITTNDNEQFAINIVNWLVSWDADVLLYTDDPFSANFYKSPLCQALNLLDIDFYLTFSSSYFNYSLTIGSWDLLAINLVNYGFADSVLDNVKNFVDNGGYLLMSSYVVNYNPSHKLWATLGFAYASNMPNNEPFYIWEDTHPIFNKPFDYNAALFQPFLFYTDDGDLLTVYNNATALAGYTASDTDDNAIIILRNDKHTLYNGYIIDELNGDNNSNGFEDRLELWTNELQFMLDQAGLLPTGAGAKIPGYDLILMLGVFGLVTCILIIIKCRRN